ETGEGHWDFSKASVSRGATSLEALFRDGGSTGCVKRRRVPSGELFSRDANRKPLRARLAISTDYQGPSPGLWDGSGTWQQVVGGFELLSDRLGVWINVPNPNGWNIGAPVATGMPFPTGVVKGIEAQALTGAKHFVLRLTCVIDSDEPLSATAGQRPSSATSFAITRRVDAGGRYKKQVVAPHSEFNTGTSPVAVRDDTESADAEACARRLAGEAGEVHGSVTVPRFTAAYRIGDKIRSIRGRELSLRTNAGAPDEEGEVFPCVVGLGWDFGNRQLTTLQLSDHRGDRG
ncbi:MAG TPA: hypothetical protein VLM40_17215, partial [Gemmata sp.]|nr:hypothetical protein [Gemmata sp.]